MLIHFVCFKYKEATDAATRQQHRDALRALANLDEVVELEVGEDVVRSSRSYDTGLLVRFPDRNALSRYQVHERHVPVAQLGVSICDHIVSVDFLA
jgi:hypothetical protein